MEIDLPYARYQRNSGSERLYICFSSRNRKPGTFDRFFAPEGVKASYIFLNCENNWYHDGIPGLGGLSESLSWLRSAIRDSGARLVTCIGSSMGAFGALWYGVHVQADCVVAFAPETVMNVPGGHSVTNMSGRDTLLLSDLSQSVTNITYVSGDRSPIDIYCGDYAARRVGGRHLVVKGAGHETAKFLQVSGDLEFFIESCMSGQVGRFAFENDEASLNDKLSPLHVEPTQLTPERVASYVESLTSLTKEDLLSIADFMTSRRFLPVALRVCEVIGERYGLCAEARFVFGNALLKSGRYSEADKQLLESLSGKPVDYRTSFALAWSYDRQKRYDEAKQFCELAMSTCVGDQSKPQRKACADLLLRIDGALADEYKNMPLVASA